MAISILRKDTLGNKSRDSSKINDRKTCSAVIEFLG